MQLDLSDEASTRAVGALLGGVLAPGDAIALVGDLGAGKTTLTQGIAAGAGATAAVTSPTFALIQEYPGRVPLVHADLYRLEQQRELDEIGLDEHVRAGAAAVLVEWADKFEVLTRDYLRITLTIEGEGRRLVADANGARASALLEAWERALTC
jgi:tRNA threonylcarbamoyladenosine biosynthesis protein TsaE